MSGLARACKCHPIRWSSHKAHSRVSPGEDSSQSLIHGGTHFNLLLCCGCAWQSHEIQPVYGEVRRGQACTRLFCALVAGWGMHRCAAWSNMPCAASCGLAVAEWTQHTNFHGMYTQTPPPSPAHPGKLSSNSDTPSHKTHRLWPPRQNPPPLPLRPSRQQQLQPLPFLPRRQPQPPPNTRPSPHRLHPLPPEPPPLRPSPSPPTPPRRAPPSRPPPHEPPSQSMPSPTLPSGLLLPSGPPRVPSLRS